MYRLNPIEIAQFNLAEVKPFVDFWHQFYEDSVKVFDSDEKIDYFAELNLGNHLNEENVRRLLRWKDPHQLTQHILTGPNAGKENSRVAKVLSNLAAINRFRSEQTTEDEIRSTVKGIFPGGIVFQAFLLHIAKPHAYPIADQYVFKVCSLHTGMQDRQDWETYVAYRNYFDQITEAMGVARTTENIRELKRVDNALMVFGQFLNAYYRRE